MPSRRATLAALASTSVAGCTAFAPSPPALDGLGCPPVDLAFDPDRVVCSGGDTDGPVGVSLGPPRVVSDEPCVVPSDSSHTYAGLAGALDLGATGPTPAGTYALVVPAALADERLALVGAFRVEG